MNIDEADLLAGADEDEEEALRAMEEEESAQAVAQATGKRKSGMAKETKVKPEPVSSGSTGAGRKGPGGAARKTGLSGEVEVLELDSDEGDGKEKVVKQEKQVKRRKTIGTEKSKKGVGGQKLGVMEIDSD